MNELRIYNSKWTFGISSNAVLLHRYMGSTLNMGRSWEIRGTISCSSQFNHRRWEQCKIHVDQVQEFLPCWSNWKCERSWEASFTFAVLGTSPEICLAAQIRIWPWFSVKSSTFVPLCCVCSWIISLAKAS